MLNDLTQVHQVEPLRQIDFLETPAVNPMSFGSGDIAHVISDLDSGRPDPASRGDAIEIELPSVSASNVEEIDRVAIAQMAQRSLKTVTVEPMTKSSDPRPSVTRIVGRTYVVTLVCRGIDGL